MFQRILNLFFPPKCLFCRKILSAQETDLCHSCRIHAPDHNKAKRNITFLAHWTAVWYYNNDVRKSILRYKFYNARSYAKPFGRFLAMKLQQDMTDHWDILSYIPISRMRRFVRGYDQVQLLAQAVSEELGVPLQPVLKKIRNTPPQSGIREVSHRRANILGAYEVIDHGQIAGKRILLLDDVLTTGATVSECAKTLLLAGAKEVSFAAIADAHKDKK